ncbi:MAG: DedA family protein [Deltaproteobacteria bacterium]|nr:DedA family protein [Deltaproteobacteria bacterium]
MSLRADTGEIDSIRGYLDHLLILIQALPDLLAYLLLGLSAFLENIFPPIPGDTITAFGAFLVGTGKLGLIGVYVSTTLGSLVGFMCLFLFGKHLGRPFFIKKNYRFFRAEDIAKAEEWFGKYGYLVVASNRFFPGFRSVISIASGISGMKTHWVAILSLLSCAVWNLIWIVAGYMIGSNWETVKAKVLRMQMKYNMLVLTILALLVICIIFRKKWPRKKH